MANATTYDSHLFEAALRRFHDDPKSLTDADMDQFRIVDNRLGERIARARAGHEDPDKPEDSRVLTFGLFMKWERDFNFPISATHRYRIRDAHAKIEKLEQRIAELESRPMLKYAGIWEERKTYASGSLVTKHGGLWLATNVTCSVPGSAASGWRLVVKRGQA